MKSIKCVAVGDECVGKTCLLKTFVDNSYPHDLVPPTVLDEYKAVISVDDSDYEVNLFDTSGMEAYDRLRPFSYPMTDAILLCFSLISMASYKSVSSKWVPEVRHHCKDTPIILVGTKVDAREFSDRSEIVKNQQGRRLKKLVGARYYVECSAQTKMGIVEVFQDAVRAAIAPPVKQHGNGRCKLL
ncbi:ras-related C3 botulinum toxin substrate 1-like isoform X1 [Mya arenaria]|uniref:ras-related C3 botulinum toxin substrate 1-like isoform X1 n=1 Tax=Mya arenaria TaxID=6604 RepID=UPI0022E5E870|nr:ras-related C3 botulinum toxin substrate 1-like isoform X1 [Mya arenaria]